MQDIAQTIAVFISAFGLLLTGVGLIFAGRQVEAANAQARSANEQARSANEQLNTSRLIAAGEFLLHLDEAFRHHDRVHRNLRPGGIWSAPNQGPDMNDADAWADVDSYMGLFERIKVLIDSGIVDGKTIDRLYGYRISNIVRNDVIRTKKLEDPNTSRGWTDFIELATQLGRYHRTDSAGT